MRTTQYNKMRTFENFNTIDEKEKLFLELAHLDELEIRFDIIEYKNIIFYFYKETNLFYQDKYSKSFCINDSKIWSVFKMNFNLKHKEINDFMKCMVDKHFELNGYTTNDRGTYNSFLLDKHFELNGYKTSERYSVIWINKHFKLNI